jgi:hypothetical protein
LTRKMVMGGYVLDQAMLFLLAMVMIEPRQELP